MTRFDLKFIDEQSLLAIANGLAIPDPSRLDDHVAAFQANVLPGGMSFGPRNYWKALKTEFHALICGPKHGETDPYEDLRKAVEKHGAKSQLAVVSSIAVFIGARIGLEAGIIVPWIAMLLGVVRKVGAEAFCRAIEEQDGKKEVRPESRR